MGCAHVQKNDVVFQSSTINALLKGIYDGDVTFGELKRNGGERDFTYKYRKLADGQATLSLKG